MSWFGINKNEGRHHTHNKPKSDELGHVHRPVIIDSNGVKHPIHGYESHNSKQYMARTEAVVKYIRFPGMADEEYTTSRMGEYGTGDLSGRKNEFAPKSHDERVGRPMNDPPWGNRFRFNSPPSNEHHHTTHDDDTRVDNTKGTKPNNRKEQNYYDDEKNRRNGFTKQGSRPNYLKDQEDYYERANPSTNGYSPPKYAFSIPTHQVKEKENDYVTKQGSRPNYLEDHEKDYYERANPNTNSYSPPKYAFSIPTRQVKEKGNDYDARGARMGPFGTPPNNEKSYETSNFKPKANSPPRLNPQPKKEQGNYNIPETIDSTEARRRYGKGAPGAAPAEDHKYSGGTIDSKAAAKKYNGVLLTD
ncbi:uncharacterized protein LOC142529159 [Primulina tabacum]|uniref:uncharacterized protein LOC142529159 n=1 Tax=Primulina tabacum TaxID=48773 RepID=UPI003F596089